MGHSLATPIGVYHWCYQAGTMDAPATDWCWVNASINQHKSPIAVIPSATSHQFLRILADRADEVIQKTAEFWIVMTRDHASITKTHLTAT